jgi:hypothetical protein
LVAVSVTGWLLPNIVNVPATLVTLSPSKLNLSPTNLPVGP